MPRKPTISVMQDRIEVASRLMARNAELMQESAQFFSSANSGNSLQRMYDMQQKLFSIQMDTVKLYANCIEDQARWFRSFGLNA